MNALASALQHIATELTEADARFALIGGLAVSIRTEPRFTRDADVVVAVSGDDQSEALIRRLQSHGYRVAGIMEQNAVGRLATARLLLPRFSEGGPVVDLLFASSGIEAEIAAAPEDEIARARGALTLIANRGYHRGRALQRALDDLLGAPDRDR